MSALCPCFPVLAHLPDGYHICGFGLALWVAEEAITCLRQIIFTDDVIPIKDGSRLVPAKPIATFSGIPVATMFRTALRRKSWIKSPW